ncbi:MAG: hypothetical protein KAR42_15120 [candidate division Zixibacteria bacterium]|nr:hypothetical protein [candidate division Zixibacteria bacterium]
MTLDENGANLVYRGGQPLMDRGLENVVLILLFTKKGWAGNALFKNPDQKIESDFVAAHEQPITLSALNEIRDAAEKALNRPVFGTVTVITTNPRSNVISSIITIEPPGRDIQTLIVSRNGLNWISQIIDPAYRKI